MQRNRPTLCMEYMRGPSKEMKKESQEGIDRIGQEKVEPFWGYFQKYSPERLLLQFKEREARVKQWEVIPFEQYYNLLKRYIEDPIGSRIPDNVVTNWVMIVCKNLAQVISIQRLFGRAKNFPHEAVEKFYDIPECRNETHRTIKCMNTIADAGFYRWALSPQGHPAWNDWGFMKVYDILTKYREDMDPGDKLILIDRCLNVVHGRGPMAEYFIEGGKDSLDKIAGK